MRKLITALLLAIVSPLAFAIVDMKSANYAETWSDLTVPGIGYDLRVSRTYNSRSLFNGIFGFGWCSDYETKIDVTTEGNLRLTECGGGMEITYTPKNFNPDKIDQTVAQIIAEIKKKRTDLKPDYIENLEREMKTNDFMREEFGRRMNIVGKAEDGVVYLANGREAENITLKKGVYKRTLADGTYQLFEASTGHMSHMYDRNQNHLKLSWEKDLLVSVSDNLGRKLTIKYNPSNKKVSEIVGPNRMSSKYKYSGEDLTEVVDARKDQYKYQYDEVHNLTRIELPDRKFKELTYNKDKDWVVTFRNTKGCIETYDYQVSKDDPKNHFWSNVVKKCNNKVTNKSKYEFFHKNRPGGQGVYLARVRTEVNDEVTDIVYHDTFGKPLTIVRDKEKTEYTYFNNGFIKSKKDPVQLTTFEYKNSCNKVSQVVVQLLGEGERKPSDTKTSKTTKTRFQYDGKKCNLVSADTSDGQKVKIAYDNLGRISQMEDQTKKLVKIKYEGKFGKPSYVTRVGLGTIRVTYRPDGEIQKVESNEGPTVAVQVANIFNNLLQIIEPATNEAPL